MNGYMRSLLGEDELMSAQEQARNNALLMAGLQGLMASGPSLTPTSFGQILGQAGMTGLTAYDESMRGAERSALQGMELDQLRQQQQADEAFKAALPEVFKGGQINYPALQQLALVYPERVGQVMQAYRSAQPPQPAAVNLQFDAKSGTVFNPRTGEVQVVPELQGRADANPQLVTVEQDGKPIQRIIDLNTGATISDVGVKPDTEKAPTDSQLMAQGYFQRMSTAEQILNPLEAQGQYPMYGAAMASSTPFVGNLARRLVMSPEEQQYEQAAADWIRSKLRKESGAVIGADEMRQEYETYFPQPGDSAAVIAQKQERRRVATEAMANAAGIKPVQRTQTPSDLAKAAREELERRRGGR